MDPPVCHLMDPPVCHLMDPPNMNKQSRDTSLVLSEWHDRGERRPISSGDSMAYEYALRGCLGFVLTLPASQVAYQTHDVLYMALMALRETTEDSTQFTPGRCRYDRSLWNLIPPVYHLMDPPLFHLIGSLCVT